MDRRVVSGMVGLIIVGSSIDQSVAGPPDPGTSRSAGNAPMEPIDRAINAGTAPSTTPGVQPPTPDTAGPVGMSPVPSIDRSINAGKAGDPAPAFGLSTFFRKARPRSAQAPVGRVTPAQAAPPIGQTWTRSPAQPSTSSGRPAPYTDQVPTAARPQADQASDTSPIDGRPAPMADDRVHPRPRTSVADRPQGPRPVAPTSGLASGRPRPPAEGPSTTPAIPATLPPLEAESRPVVAPPVEVPAVPPPIPGDPMAATPIAPVVPVPVVAAPTVEVTEQAQVDPQVTQTGADSTAIKLAGPKVAEPRYAGLRAASVGDEIITLHELNVIVTEKYREVTQGQDVPKDQERQIKNMLAGQALDYLIEQAVILQEAKRILGKNPKNQQQFADFIIKKWKDDELPPLLRQYSVSNEFELKKKLTDMGKNYEDMREAYRKTMMAREFQMMKIRDKISADLSEQKAYYLEHIHEFDQPARFSFREIEVKIEKYPDRAAAKAQAEALRARLAKEDFAIVAQSKSEGPTADKGGLYADMAPGGYGIPSVNDELNRLPIGQVSGVIEAPGSFHVVRVESRREAGPLRFDEVQAKVHEAVFERNFTKARTDFVAGLRAKTLIRTMFDNTESDPARVRRQIDAAIRPASAR